MSIMLILNQRFENLGKRETSIFNYEACAKCLPNLPFPGGKVMGRTIEGRWCLVASTFVD